MFKWFWTIFSLGVPDQKASVTIPKPEGESKINLQNQRKQSPRNSSVKISVIFYMDFAVNSSGKR